MEIPGICGVNSVMVDARERWDGNVYVDGCDNGGKFQGCSAEIRWKDWLIGKE